MFFKKFIFSLVFCLLSLLSSNALALPNNFIKQKQVQSFISQFSKKHDYPKAELTALFSKIKPDPEIIKSISTPAEKWDWGKYKNYFLTKKRVKEGVDFWKKHKAVLKKAEKQFHVPPEIIVAIIGVETFYGQRKGRHEVLTALSTLAFHYPKRAKFFKKELGEFLLLTHEEGLPVLEIKGSYAGAMGIPQFIASSYRAYAIDFAKSGKKDLINNPVNAIGSVANYFKKHGWKKNMPIALATKSNDSKTQENLGIKTYDSNNSPSPKPLYTLSQLKRKNIYPKDSSLKYAKILSVISLKNKDNTELWLGTDNFYVITRYNLSTNYAMAVFQLSERIKAQYQRQLV